ncbi:hypothetical protein Peur_001393 [Populus x canadensis]
MVTGDKTAFCQCGFAGVQNTLLFNTTKTLLDDGGRHYFKRCSIQGAVDFIFDCSIQALGGFIPAQGRTNPNDANGFLFKGCNVIF